MSSNEFVPYDLIVLLSGISVSLKVFLVSSLFWRFVGFGARALSSLSIPSIEPDFCFCERVS